jgi:hypothetical protein
VLNKHSSSWWCWPVLVVAAVESRNFCCSWSWSSNQTGVGWSWLLPASSVKFHSKRILKSQWVYFAPQFQFFWSKVSRHVFSVGPYCTAWIYFACVLVIRKFWRWKEIFHKYFVS